MMLLTMTECDLLEKEIHDLAREIESELVKQFGPVLVSERLSQALGFPTISAFRQALCRQKMPVTVFSLPDRKGKFALTKDVSKWLSTQRCIAAREQGACINADLKGQ